MKQSIVAVVCILSLLAPGSHAQGPNLSPSFSFQGRAAVTVGTTPPTVAAYTSYDLAIDATRGLSAFYATGLYGTQPITVNSIVSINDSTVYVETDGACSSATFTVDPSNPFTYRENFWSIFDNAVESPAGTYTVIEGTVTLVLMTVDGSPTSFVFTFTGTPSIASTVTITSYTNRVPPFSLFTLPSACSSQFTCNACYSSAVVNTSSLLLLMLALAIVYSMM